MPVESLIEDISAILDISSDKLISVYNQSKAIIERINKKKRMWFNLIAPILFPPVTFAFFLATGTITKVTTLTVAVLVAMLILYVALSLYLINTFEKEYNKHFGHRLP